MKLAKTLIHARIPQRTKRHMMAIQAYFSKTATAIIEDALEKGLTWYMKQIQAELGYSKENPLTWEKLEEQVKLSVITENNNTPEPKDEEVENALKDLL